MEIIYMGLGNESVHIGTAQVAGGQHGKVLAMKLLYRDSIPVRIICLIKGIKIIYAPFLQHVTESQEDTCRGFGIIDSPVVR